MPSSPSLRRTLVIAALVVAWLVAMVVVGAPAHAHGAMANPVSRAVACGPEGGAAASSAACQAAAAASGGAAAFTAWDVVKVPNVNGRDRQRIPDGQLCSAGLTQFAGLDLARPDWPTTTLTAGARFTFKYRVTIPHRGSFRLYVTKAGYSPTQPLRWTDLETKPFLTVTNPKIVGGAYTFTGRLPAGKSGRHLIYTIWQTTSTPDTYYSCSDVIFGAVTSAAPVAPSAPAASAASSARGATIADASPIAAEPVAAVTHSNPAVPIALSIGIGLAAATAVLVIRYRRVELARQAAARARQFRGTVPPY